MKESKYACVGILSMVVALSLSSCSTSTYTVKNRPESFTYSPTSDGKKDTSYSYGEADKGEQKGEKKKEKEEKTPENLQDILTERYSTFTPAECLKGMPWSLKTTPNKNYTNTICMFEVLLMNMMHRKRIFIFQE